MKKIFIFLILALNLAFSSVFEEFGEEAIKKITNTNLEKCKNGDDEICDLIAIMTNNNDSEDVDGANISPQKMAEFLINKNTIKLCENGDKDICIFLSLGMVLYSDKSLDDAKEFALKSENIHLIDLLDNQNFENIINSCQNGYKSCEYLSIMQKYGIFVKKDEEKAKILKEKVCKDEAGFFCSKYDTGILDMFSAFCDKGSIKACILLFPAFEEVYQIPYAIFAQNRLLNLYENSGISLGENLFEKALNDKEFLKFLNENLDIFLALFSPNEEYNLIKDSDLPKYYGLLAKNGFDFEGEIETIKMIDFTIFYTKDEILVEIFKNILSKLDLNSPALLGRVKDCDKKQSFKFLMENGASNADDLLFEIVFNLASPFGYRYSTEILKANKLNYFDKKLLKSDKYQKLLKNELFYMRLILKNNHSSENTKKFIKLIANFANLINDNELNEVLFNIKP